MSLIVETGAGITGANSYVDRTYADAYHAEFGNTDWDGFEDDAKDAALIQASKSLDIQYGDRYRGQVVPSQNTTRQLLFPRLAFNDLYGTLWNAMVPTYLLNAACELALLKLNGADITPLVSTDTSIISEVAVGSVRIKKQYSGAAPQQEIYTGMGKVEQILKPMLKSPTNNMVLYR